MTCPSIWQQTFGVDVFGNLTKNGSQSFTPTYNSATNRINGGGYSAVYDANGNMTNDGMTGGATTFSWDSEGKPYSITKSGTTTGVTYDAFG
ncbi:MAG: hypothetical protein ACXVZV_15140, partial [Terriglobales bacterium]